MVLPKEGSGVYKKASHLRVLCHHARARTIGMLDKGAAVRFPVEHVIVLQGVRILHCSSYDIKPARNSKN